MSPVGDANLTAVLLHDPGANRQAQPGGIATAAKARLEDVFNLVRPDAAASVGEFDDHVTAATFAVLGSLRSETVTLPPAGV